MLYHGIKRRQLRLIPVDDVSRKNKSGSPIFNLPLQTTVVPTYAHGSRQATFTRATTATVLDFEGLIKPVLSGEVRFKGARRVHNLEDNSGWVNGSGTPFTPTGWSYAASTGTTTTSASVVNVGHIALTVAGSTQRQILTRAYTVAVGTELRFSFEVEDIEVNPTDTVATFTSGTDIPGSVTGAGIAAGGVNRYVTDLVTATSTSVVVRFGLGTNNNATGEITISSPMLQDSTGQAIQSVDEYVSTGVLSSPFHGTMVDGTATFLTANANTVSSNIVTEATGAPFDATDFFNDASGPFGYRAESQHINIALHGRTFEDIVWGTSNITANDNEVAGADGRTRAASLTATAANGTIIQDLGDIADTDYAFGPWIKRKTGTGDIDLTVDGGSTWNTITVTADWTRVEITDSVNDPDIGIRIVVDTDAIFVDYAQAEASTFLHSTTPETVASAITVNADVLTYASAGNIIDQAGTAFASASTDWEASPGGTSPLSRDDNGRMLRFNDTDTPTRVRSFDGTNSSQSPVGGTTAFNAPQGLAATWGTALTAYWNGSPDATPASYDGTMGTGDIGIGVRNDGAAFFWNGTIRFVQFYPRELNASQVGGLPR